MRLRHSSNDCCLVTHWPAHAVPGQIHTDKSTTANAFVQSAAGGPKLVRKRIHDYTKNRLWGKNEGWLLDDFSVRPEREPPVRPTFESYRVQDSSVPGLAVDIVDFRIGALPLNGLNHLRWQIVR